MSGDTDKQPNLSGRMSFMVGQNELWRQMGLS